MAHKDDSGGKEDPVVFSCLTCRNNARKSKVISYVFLFLSLTLVPGFSFANSMLKLPFLPSPENYGDVLMEKAVREKDVAPVAFSHLIHRVKYTCRVCHYELEFSMKSNDTPIICDNGKMRGTYCAACHNGKVAFGAEDKDGENCSMCHARKAASSWKKFLELREKLPKSKFGNEIDWSKALDEGLIKPEDS